MRGRLTQDPARSLMFRLAINHHLEALWRNVIVREDPVLRYETLRP